MLPTAIAEPTSGGDADPLRSAMYGERGMQIA